MEKNKGFTLIELLSVIVILAVIALIATPLIMNVINDAKEGSAKNSANGYVKALEQSISQQMVKDNTFKPDERQIGVGKVTGANQQEMTTGNLTTHDVTYDIKYTGTKPTGIDFILKNGTVVRSSKITISGYTFTMDEKGEWVLKGTPIELPKSFETDSWDTIARAVISENYPYKVGDTKEVQVGNLGTFTVRVANTTTPESCSQAGYSQSACGFVVEFEDVVTVKRMMDYNGTNVGGYPVTDMEKYVSGDLFKMLSEDLQRNIKTTAVVSSHGKTEGETNVTSVEKLYLLSTKEIYGKKEIESINQYDTSDSYTHQLEYYQSKNVTINHYNAVRKKYGASIGYYWWLRSAHADAYSDFYYILPNGSLSAHHSTVENGVSPAFRIG